MKILFITHYFAPDSGAAANRLTRLAQHLQQRGHEVTVLTTVPHYPTGVVPEAYRGKWAVVEDLDGIRVIQVWLWTSTNPKITWRLLSQLTFMVTCSLRGMFLKRPDVIFIENQPIFTGLAGWFISLIKRRRYVVNVSDYWPEYLVVTGHVKESSLIYRTFKWLTNLTQRHAHAIIVMLADLLTKIENRIGKVENAHVINNAVDLSLYGDADAGQKFRDAHDLGDKRLVTFLGVLGAHIDLDTMLAAVKPLADHDVLVLFVGSGTQKETLVQALEDPAFAHCRYIDWIDKDQVPGFWLSSYLTFWALHQNELDKMRFQAKLFEALASGTPPVIAVEGLMSEFFDETQTGFAVPPQDAEAMTRAIVSVLEDDKAYAAMRQRGIDYATANFDLEKHIDDYEQVLLQVADDKS